MTASRTSRASQPSQAAESSAAMKAGWAKGTRPTLWLLLGLQGVFESRQFSAPDWHDHDLAVALRISHRIVSEAVDAGSPRCMLDLAEAWSRAMSIEAWARLEVRHQFEFHRN